MGHCFYQSANFTSHPRKREVVWEQEREMKKEKEKREIGKERNKQTKQVVGVTYQVPLFFPSFHASLEAL